MTLIKNELRDPLSHTVGSSGGLPGCTALHQIYLLLKVAKTLQI